MSQISQIVSTATKRWQVEISLQQSQRTMQKVLDNINANILLAIMTLWRCFLQTNLSGKKPEACQRERHAGKC